MKQHDEWIHTSRVCSASTQTSSSEQVEVMSELAIAVAVFGFILWTVSLAVLAWADITTRQLQAELAEDTDSTPPWERESGVDYEIYEYGDR